MKTRERYWVQLQGCMCYIYSEEWWRTRNKSIVPTLANQPPIYISNFCRHLGAEVILQACMIMDTAHRPGWMGSRF